MAIIALITITVFSCKKTTEKPLVVQSAESESNLARVPGLVALSSTIKQVNHFQDRLKATFDASTASFYPGTLYAHYSLSATGPWSSGVLPVGWSSPVAGYIVTPLYAVGTTVYIFYSTLSGTTYPSGSATPIYSAVVM